MLKALAAGGRRSWLDEVRADSPLGLWLMQESSGTTIVADTGGAGTYSTTGRTPHAVGPGKAALPFAMQFDGTNAYGSIAHNFGSAQQITVCCWAYWDTFANDDDLLMEYTPNYNNAGGWIIDPNAASGTFEVVQSSTGDGTIKGGRYTRPSAAAWHHYAFTFDRTLWAATQFYLDAVLQTPGTALSAGTDWPKNLANSTLYLMSRNTSTLRGAGRMAGLSLHSSILSGARIAAHFAGA